jgi:hypothetical protein
MLRPWQSTYVKLKKPRGNACKMEEVGVATSGGARGKKPIAKNYWLT